MTTVLLFLILALSLINSFVLVILGVFLVRFRDQITLQQRLPVPIPNKSVKNWEDKYEEELNEFQRRLRADAGLVELPLPQVKQIKNEV
jgi:hypothetical protein